MKSVIDTSLAVSVNPQTAEMISDSFNDNISIDAAKTVMKEWDSIQEVISNDPSLTKFYADLNSLSTDLIRSENELANFEVSHEGLIQHGFDSKVKISDINKKKNQYTLNAKNTRNQAKVKFDIIFDSLVNSGREAEAQKFMLMYDMFGDANQNERIQFDNDTWSGWIGNILNPYNKDTVMWGDSQTLDIIGPSFNESLGEWEYKDTFKNVPIGVNADTPITRSYFDDVVNSLDDSTRELFFAFGSDLNLLQNTTEQFNHLNSIMDDRKSPVIGYMSMPTEQMIEGGVSQKEKYKKVESKRNDVKSKIIQ